MCSQVVAALGDTRSGSATTSGLTRASPDSELALKSCTESNDCDQRCFILPNDASKALGRLWFKTYSTKTYIDGVRIEEVSGSDIRMLLKRYMVY